ncbi:actin-5c-related [Anaeramoeba flamelloides]|uniref:Actin-5c-related n=1 Tax=Anaeramoeba flamelloides TaxID=1746091 RepID=A0ABQ8Z523_9EUKA|nr:actin-5c-related [Anaeramoeba flamelloides]
MTSEIIIDINEEFIYFGKSNDEKPRIFPTCLIDENGELPTHYTGIDEEVMLKSAFKKGQVEDFAVLEQILTKCFDSQSITAQGQGIFLPQNINTSRSVQEKYCEFFFEKCNVEKLAMDTSGALPLKSKGIKTGLCINVGESFEVVPMFDNQVNHDLSLFVPLSTRLIRDTLASKLTLDGYYFDKVNHKYLLSHLRDSIGVVVPDFEEEMKNRFDFQKLIQIDFSRNEKEYSKEYSFSHSVFWSCETLFNPKMIMRDIPGIHQLTNEILQALDNEQYQQISKNVLINGSASAISGFNDRFEKELQNISVLDLNIMFDENNNFSNWLASKSCLENYQHWCSKEKYLESGFF